MYTTGIFLNNASGNGIWALASGIWKNMGWEMGLEPLLQDPFNGMRIDVIRYEPHTLSLRLFKLFFQQLH